MQLRFRQGKDNVDVEDESCRSEIGKQSPLTEAGFKSVAESCCFDDMKDFIRRVVTADGDQVCDEGGLSGFTPFYSCPSTPSSLADLRVGLGKATSESGNPCAWLGKAGAACTPPAASCSVVANPTSSQTLVDGFVGLSAGSNPSALVTKPAVKDSVKNTLSSKLGVPGSAIVVTMGSGPLTASLLEFNKSSAASCTVYATYVVTQTTPPTLNAAALASKMEALDSTQLETDLASAVAAVAPEVGVLKVTKVKSCKDGGSCKEKKLRPDVSRASADPSAAPSAGPRSPEPEPEPEPPAMIPPVPVTTAKPICPAFKCSHYASTVPCTGTYCGSGTSYKRICCPPTAPHCMLETVKGVPQWGCSKTSAKDTTYTTTLKYPNVFKTTPAPSAAGCAAGKCKPPGSAACVGSTCHGDAALCCPAAAPECRMTGIVPTASGGSKATYACWNPAR